MRRKPILALCIITLALTLVSPVTVQACHRPRCAPRLHMKPIVSTHWLNKHLDHPRLVILDVRNQGYEDGHILGAIHRPPFFNWVIHPPSENPEWWPWLELPDTEDLYDTLGNAGITKDTWVVVVGNTGGPMPPHADLPYGLYNNADITRVAMTLVYAGVKNVAILDGGIEMWVNDGYDLVPDVPDITTVTYDGIVKETMFVSTEYVEYRIGKARLVDARDEIVYCGDFVEPWPPNPTAGHIPTARNLPTPSLWNVEFDDDGNVAYATYKNIGKLIKMAREVVGRRWFGWGWRRCHREIIVYCGVGGYASTVFFVLSEVLGFQNVKVYDGSWQEWTSDPLRDVEVCTGELD